MKYIKFFEAKKKSLLPLRSFCNQYLAYLLDDDTFKLKINEGKAHLINSFTNKQNIILRDSPRFDTIVISREQIKVIPRRNWDYNLGEYVVQHYNETKPITFNWEEVNDYIIPFILILDRRYRVVSITLVINNSIKGIRISDIENINPQFIKEIYITVRN